MQTANLWKQAGRISVWRYTENSGNYPGWHLTADPAGCQSLLALLDALAADGVGSRAVAITAPGKADLAVPNNRQGRAAWGAPQKLRLTLAAAEQQWWFPPGLDPAALTLGAAWLPALRHGVAGIPAGQGDYSIGKGSLPLWFWW